MQSTQKFCLRTLIACFISYSSCAKFIVFLLQVQMSRLDTDPSYIAFITGTFITCEVCEAPLKQMQHDIVDKTFCEWLTCYGFEASQTGVGSPFCLNCFES